VLQGSALAAFFTVGTSRLSDSLENGRGRVHGWTTVGDRRCVLVEVVDRADLQVALGLDPAAQFLPVAVWSVLPPAAEPTNLRPSPSWVRVPYQTADGSSGDLVRRLLRKYTATSIGVLGETRAPFPSGIEADLDRLGGVRLSVTVEASADREDETPFGASGAGLARLLPGSGSLSDTDASQVIEFGTGGPPRGADGAAAPDRNAGTLPPTHPADDESSLVTWLLLGILAALASATVWRLLAALRHAPPRKGAHE
jgi:hypothetical protein